ncbi:MAG: hypothetical protein HYZ20_14025 [Burkholderiales bacterium]|nr:hypothetical protein [Burkholderiales bacterium]
MTPPRHRAGARRRDAAAQRDPWPDDHAAAGSAAAIAAIPGLPTRLDVGRLVRGPAA